MLNESMPESETRLRDRNGRTFLTQRILKERGNDKTIYAVKSQLPCRDCPTSSHHHGTEIALKRYTPTMQALFLREARMLKIVHSLHHRHIMFYLASYQNGDGLFIMLPLGEGNLYEFWMRTDPKSDLHGYEVWFADQVAGLVDALRLIHEISCPVGANTPLHTTQSDSEPLGIIHGDIRPENLVVFLNEGTAKPRVKLADFEMSLWSDEIPQSFPFRMQEAPETRLAKIISKKSDIWSLGCVLVEFTTWLVDGASAVIDARERRHMRTAVSNTPWLKDDRFFLLEYQDKRAISAKVKDVVVECVQDLLREERCATKVQRILAVVGTGMLVIRLESRKSAAELAIMINTLDGSVS